MKEWKKEAKPYRNDAEFWASSWKAMGEPSSGPVSKKRSQSKDKFVEVAKKLKKKDAEEKATRKIELEEIRKKSTFKMTPVSDDDADNAIHACMYS